MKVLVTGAAGFLGSNVVRCLLERGHQVTALARDANVANDILQPGADVFEADARDVVAVKKAVQGCGAIVHCAALVGMDSYALRPVETMETELDTMRAVCAGALTVPGCKVIYASSSAVYGNRPGPDPFDEDLEAVGATSYSISKRYNELYLAAQHHEHSLPSVSVRIFNVYGPGQDHRLVIPRFVQRALAGEPLVIYGDGKNIRDFVYIDDVVDVMADCIERFAGCHVLNVAAETPVSVLQLAQAIISGTDSKSEISFRPIPSERGGHEVTWSVGSIARLRKLLGPRKMKPLNEGLKATIASLSSNV